MEILQSVEMPALSAFLPRRLLRESEPEGCVSLKYLLF
jgi:hypothetical protein